MTTKNSLTHLAYRSCIDAIEDVLGENGKNSVLRFAGLEGLIENPIDYDPEARVPYEYVTKMFLGVRDLLGDHGYEAVMFRGGRFMIRNVVQHSEAFQNLIAMDIDVIERLKLAYQGYVTNAGYDPEKTLEFLPEQKQIINHRPDCTECEELVNKGTTSLTKPSCAFVRGLLHGVGDCFEKELSVSVVEDKCRFVGDDQCRYVITYEVK